ncbi:hypothetical protein D9M68_690090 [compost metagenome]
MTDMLERTLTGLKRKGTLQKWRDERGQLRCRIWSGEWHLYWRPDGCGYTEDVEQAGIYRLDDAIRRSGHCGPGKKITYRFLPESS